MGKTLIGGTINVYDDRWRVSIHEAGHVAVMRYHGIGFEFATAYREPVKCNDGVTYGLVSVGDENRWYEGDGALLFNVSAAGIAAERMFGVLSDRASTNDMLAMMTATEKMGGAPDSIDLMMECAERLFDTMMTMIDEILVIAAGLYVHTVLTYDDVCELLANHEGTVKQLRGGSLTATT